MEPEPGQRREKDGEIPSTVGGKKSGYVLNADPATVSEKSVGDPCELEEEAGAVSCESSAPSCDREVLAGESSEKKVKGAVLWWSAPALIGGLKSFSAEKSLPVNATPQVSHIFEAGDSGEVSGEDFPSVWVGLALEADIDSRSVHPEVEASDA